MKFYALILTAIFGVCCAYAADSNAPVAAPAPESNAPAGVAAADSVAVTVDGQKIMESDVEKKVAPRLKAMSGQIPEQYAQEYKKQLRTRAIEGLVIETLLDKKITDQNITVSDDEVKAEMAKQLQEQKMTEDDLKKVLTMYGLNFDEYKAQLKRGLAYNKLLDAQMTGKVDVNDAEIKKYYDENSAEFKTPEQVRASHILISTRSVDPNADANAVKAEAKKKAESILAEIKNGGDFAELAKKNSSCPSAEKGGDLGFFGRGQMVPEFDAAAFGMKVGDVNGPVETQFGYHIIKVTEHKDPNTTSFDQAKDQIKERLINTKKGGLAKGYVDELKSKAKIEYPAGKEPKAAEGTQVIGGKPAADANASKE